MKKTLLISALAVAATLTAGAKTADELRVYINPGHGSWTANDRPLPVMGHEQAHSRYNTDTLSFFESNTNLRKGFGVLERLREYGLKFDPTLNQEGERWQIGAARDMSNNIVMSHVKCGPYHDDNPTLGQVGQDASLLPVDHEYYNRKLSEIDAEVIANNFDMFISIHSNALNEGTTTNYPLFLYRGYDTPKEDTGVDLEQQTTSKAMADACWPYLIGNPHYVWTSYTNSKNIRGDINFYGSSSTSDYGFKGYLGVLKHNAPGFLVEGYFHTYQPARHRAMNFDTDYVEGYGYAHGIADYFGLQKEDFGTIYGIVRDQHERFTASCYKPNPMSADLYMSLNGVTVTLLKDGEKVAEYLTDNFYNGAFVFDKVAPGKYTLTFSHPDYKDIEPVEVEVKAATVSYPTASLENKDYVAPRVEFTDYPDPAAKVQGVRPADEYAFEAEYTDVVIPELEGLTVRRTIVRDDKMYILAIDKPVVYAQVVSDEEKPNPTILVYDLAKKEVAAKVSTEGTYGSIQNVSDIQLSADGILVASSQTKNQFSDTEIQDLPDGTKEPRGTAYIYKWANDENGLPTGDPEKWISYQNAGRWYRSYTAPTFALTGTLDNCKIAVAQPSITAPNHTLRLTLISVVTNAEGKDVVSIGDITSPNDINHGAVGLDMRYTISPLMNDTYLATGKDVIKELRLGAADKESATSTGNEEFAGIPATVGAFRYANNAYMVVPATTEAGNAGVRLIDVNSNISKAAQVSTINTTIEAAEAANVATAGETLGVYDEIYQKWASAYINLYLLRDGKITKFTTKGVKQPVHRAEMAYDLKQEEVADGDAITGYNISYKVSGDAVAAELILTDAQTGDEKVIALPAPVKGENTYTLDTADLGDDTFYNWAVRITSKANATDGEIFAEAHGLTARRGGVVTLTDPTQPTYGYTVVNHGNHEGIDIYDPTGEKVGTRLWKNHKVWGTSSNQSDPFRGHEREGKAVLAGWGDSSYGIMVVDPLGEEEPYGMYAGTKQSAGHYILDGVNVGGGVAGLCFVGTGEDTKLYTFSEDHEGGNGGGATENSVVRYNIGSKWVIDEKPTVIGFKSLMANTNVDMLGFGNGFFMAQVRGAGNNAEGTPGFVYVNTDKDETDWHFNSASIEGMDECMSGFAITTDGKTAAVAESKRIAIYDVTWNDDVPTKFTLRSAIPINTIGWAHMRFDAAGNLHTYLREDNGYHVYALSSEKPQATTPATGFFAKTTGINDITVEAANDGAETYYNLNGIRVNGSNMTPGVYVRVANGTATKVIVK